MINSLLIKYENTIMKHYRYAQEQNIYTQNVMSSWLQEWLQHSGFTKVTLSVITMVRWSQLQ